MQEMLAISKQIMGKLDFNNMDPHRAPLVRREPFALAPLRTILDQKDEFIKNLEFQHKMRDPFYYW